MIPVRGTLVTPYAAHLFAARKTGTPRGAKTYRGARRNAARGLRWVGVTPHARVEHPPVRQNRSQNHDRPGLIDVILGA